MDVTAPGRYALDRAYTRLRADLARGDLAASWKSLQDALRVDFGRPPPPLAALKDASAVLDTGLSFHGFKPAELVMFDADLKPVVKFEDIPREAAARFARQHAHNARLTVTDPYTKDYFNLKTRHLGLGPVAQAASPLVTIYASRSDAGERLARLERDHPKDVLGAATLLGIPLCCARAFHDAATEARSDQDAPNDDAVRRFVAAGQGSPFPHLTNPLHDHELLGFFPCRPTCSAALDRAERVRALLAARFPQVHASLPDVLGAPILFFRTPFFARLPRQTGGSTRVNAFVDPLARRAQRLFAAAVLPDLGGARELQVMPGRIEGERKDGGRWAWKVLPGGRVDFLPFEITNLPEK